ncbi:MarR family winged helix-turn-helix transcriptional regulator [Levilactobacillus lindianensis]|uniref:MarR family winged helix-turn-helix transcriptional regulator n=1 Tax=Levilactobacillus lindianensis TaxID=2486018 RepID=UPI000F736C66|nr:MarR family transcriptional regulator [Levilactobacillus lindianensis]
MNVSDQSLANQLCFALYRASRLYIKLYQQALQPFALTYPQYLVLRMLWEADHQPLHTLGNQLDFGSNTLTPLLRRMEQRGWIQRRPVATDRRQLIIHLTDQGRQAQAPVSQAIQQLTAQQQLSTAEGQLALMENQAIIADLQHLLAHQSIIKEK